MTWPDAPVAVAAVKAQEPIAVPTDARADLVSDDAEKTARRAEPTNNAGMSIIIFLLLALGLAVVGIVSRVVVKNVAARRARIIIDRSEPNTVDDQREHERRDDHPHAFLSSKGRSPFICRSAVSDPRPLRDDGGAFQITQEISKRRDKLAQLRQDIYRTLQSPASQHEEWGIEMEKEKKREEKQQKRATVIALAAYYSTKSVFGLRGPGRRIRYET